MSLPDDILDTMLQALLARAHSGLHDPQERELIAQRLSFEIDGKLAGSVTRDDAAFLASHIPGLNLDDDSLSIAPVCATDGDPVLERIALTLNNAGRLPRWRNELMAILSDDGTMLGCIERAAMRPLGLNMAATHLVGQREDGRYWLQLRAHDKDTDPGKWDTLAGGLVGTEVIDGHRQREGLRLATIRESWEEAGIEPALLQDMRALPSSRINRMVSEGHMMQDNHVFICTLPIDFTPDNRDGEVAGFEHFSRDEVIELIAADKLALEPAMIMLQIFTT